MRRYPLSRSDHQLRAKLTQFFFNNKGAVIREGDILAEIVPTDSGLQIEAFIDHKGIGFIEPGQKNNKPYGL